jgi:hypothetical protein
MASIIKKTAETQVKADKNGKSYKTCTFSKMQAQEMELPGLGKVVVHQQARETSVNLYAESYLDQKMQYGYDIPAGTDRMSFLFGDIVTRTVQPYILNTVDRITGDIQEREVNTFTTVVFGNSDAGNWETLVKAAFRSRGHIVVADAAPIAIPTNESPAVDFIA